MTSDDQPPRRRPAPARPRLKRQSIVKGAAWLTRVMAEKAASEAGALIGGAVGALVVRWLFG